MPLTLKVRPQGERVAIPVPLDGKPFIEWEGLQSDLSLSDGEYPPGMIILIHAWHDNGIPGYRHQILRASRGMPPHGRTDHHSKFFQAQMPCKLPAQNH
jgi:hypothetical protein